MFRVSFILVLAVVAVSGQSSPRFTVSDNCTACHSAIPYPAGAIRSAEPSLPFVLRQAAKPPVGTVGPQALWKSSSMANSAVDPYWQARVRWEARQHPTAAAVIEDTCMHCHAPMQRYEAHAAGTMVKLNDMDALGRNGVSCTLCHQITPDRLGTKESFTAEFVINEQKQIYGPHANPFANPMAAQTGYTPTLGAHLAESAMCGSCHTVITPVLDAAGAVTGEFVEQAPYLEWLASRYPSANQSCQSCHMPRLSDTAGRDIAQQIATRPNGGFFTQTSPRQPFGMHSFSGGNVLLAEMMKAIAPANTDALEGTAARATESLAGAIALGFTTRRDGDELKVEVSVRNLTGHKFPTGFPSRRMWLHVRVADAGGNTVFESGRPDAITGGIVGWNGDRKHRNEIGEEDEVIVYEAVLADAAGQPTNSLLSAARLWKDNRILPEGFRGDALLPVGISNESIAPIGVEDDETFTSGADRVTYEMDADPRMGPFTVTVAALYQTIRPGEVSGFSANGSAEEAKFLELFASRRAPIRIARKEGVVR